MRRIDLKKANVARSNTVRDINRQIVLNYVRDRGLISRADIARETDLQRSTVSVIVGELQEAGLIKEVYGESSGGRPPALLTLKTGRPAAIGIDLGTAKTSVATCDLTGRILKKEEFPTDMDADRNTEIIIETIHRLLGKNISSIKGIGMSLPALVDANNGAILFSPYFKWSRPTMIEDIAAKTGFPVTADNDANAAALAELWFGRPEVQDARDFILVFIENGIGTGIVFDGQLYRGMGGVAGEFGHMRIGTGAPVACANGGTECWEAFASERAALVRYTNLLGNLVNKGPITFEQLIGLGVRGDENAIKALKETAHFIGIGLRNLIQGLSPDVIVVGGTIVKAWGLISSDIRDAIKVGLCETVPETHIIPSSLGAEPALMGAFSLVLSSIFSPVSH